MDFTLEVAPRLTVGRHVSSLRRQGLVPGIVYGHAVTPFAVEVPDREFSRVFHRAGRSHLLQLKVEGEPSTRPVLIKELQLNPRTAAAVHVDFFQVNLLEKLTVQVPVVLVGEPPAIKLNVGELLHLVHQIEVSCLPDAIPGEIDIDISELAAIDDAVRIGAIRLPEGVELAGTIDPEEVIAKIAPTRVQEEEEVPAAAEAGALPAAGAEGPPEVEAGSEEP
ncbi:MAG: 50S ribosomal protein L25 [Candidatus Dormibacteria bacterium]|jgi:large subunit ribosomal protein L25